MYLMFKDVKVMYINDNKKGDISIFYPDMLPKSLFYELIDTSREIKSSNDIYISNNSKIVDWLASRVLSISRKHAKKILNACKYTQSQSISDKARISLQCRAVSVNDCFWIKMDDELIKWKDVNVRNNKLSDIVLNISLRGESLSLADKSLMNPEISTFGVAAKSWIRESGKLNLLKGNNFNDYSVQKEYCASRLLDCFDVKHVTYDIVDYNGLTCTKCECMSNADLSIVSTLEVKKMFAFDDELFYNFVLCNFADDYYKMCIMDFILMNVDRHDGNWGFYMDNNTMELVGLHPLFDHDNAFDESDNWQTESLTMPDKTLLSAAEESMKYVRLELLKPLDSSWFSWDNVSFDKLCLRLKKLGIK